MFLNESDYITIINTEELAVISNSNTSFERDQAEKMAISKIKEILSRQIDVEYEFSQIGDSRNITLVEYTIYFTIYILYTRIAKANVPEDRYEQYKEARDFFKMIQEDKITSSLKRKMKSNEEEENPAVRFGTNPQSKHIW